MPDVIINGPEGRIEARYYHARVPAAPMALVLHPHPQHGGTMNNKVVYTLYQCFVRRGFSTLRFNFRGVGHSEGTHDHGRGEQDDVRAALAEMRRRLPGLPLVLGGFSFGASMALRVGCTEQGVRALFALGLPVMMMTDLSFLQACPPPRLFVQGEGDPFGGGNFLRELVARLPEPRSLVIVPGADHFFGGHLDEMQEAVT